MSDETKQQQQQQQQQPQAAAAAAAPIIGDQLMVSDDLPIGDAPAMVPFALPARVPPDDEDEAGG